MMATNMNEDVSSVLNIGFDMILGPTMRWKKDLSSSNVQLDYDQFAMTTYLAFKGGNDGGPRPQAIVYDKFSVVGFTRGLDLICVFLKSTEALNRMAMLKSFAEEIAISMENDDDDPNAVDDGEEGEDHEEIKRIVLNVLRGNELSTPDLRRSFELTNSGIWKIMSDLEHDGLVKRVGKSGRSIIWTLA